MLLQKGLLQANSKAQEGTYLIQENQAISQGIIQVSKFYSTLNISRLEIPLGVYNFRVSIPLKMSTFTNNFIRVVSY
jgi:hypothetical protein